MKFSFVSHILEKQRILTIRIWFYAEKKFLHKKIVLYLVILVDAKNLKWKELYENYKKDRLKRLMIEMRNYDGRKYMSKV